MVACPPGSYGIKDAGQSYSDACTSCEPGYYCPSSSMLKTSQVVCGAGGYCPSGSSGVTLCPAGTYSTAVGQTTIATCEPCLSGKYCPNGGNTAGFVCPEGSYCPTGTITYTTYPCPSGRYSDVKGLASASECKICPAGSYCPTGSTSPLMCPSGTYQSSTGGQSPLTCLPCEPGFACPVAGMTAMTTQCSPGYYCPPGTQSPSQYACPAGTYSDAVDIISPNDCLACPPGHTCKVGSTSGTLNDCLPGKYCPLGTSFGNDVSCPAGTYSNIAGLQSSDQCTECPGGYYCVGGQSNVTGTCSPGYYCPPGTISPTAFACPAGTYSSQSNLQDVSQVLVCFDNSLSFIFYSNCPKSNISI